MEPFLKFRTVLEFSECYCLLSSVLWGGLRLESARLVTVAWQPTQNLAHFCGALLTLFLS